MAVDSAMEVKSVVGNDRSNRVGHSIVDGGGSHFDLAESKGRFGKARFALAGQIVGSSRELRVAEIDSVPGRVAKVAVCLMPILCPRSVLTCVGALRKNSSKSRKQIPSSFLRKFALRRGKLRLKSNFFQFKNQLDQTIKKVKLVRNGIMWF